MAKKKSAKSVAPKKFANVADTPFDFRTRRRIGDRLAETGHGYDHNYVLNGAWGTLRPVAEVFDP